MRLRLGAAVTSAVAISVGLIVLIGLLVGDGFGLASDLTRVLRIREWAALFFRLATITVAFTLLIGILNLMVVHLGRVTRRRSGALYSVVVLLTFVFTLLLHMGSPDISASLLEGVQVAMEATLIGLLFFSLVYGAYRLQRRRVTWANTLFVLTILVVLVGALPLPGLAPLRTFTDWLAAVPAAAGARGILLGIALATVVTGMRVLLGQDRSYRE